MKYLIVGLGNIGAEYADTRHNIGFDVLDALAEASNTSFTTDRYGAVATLRSKGHTLVLLKPSTYMNLSGKAVRYWLDAEKIPRENLLVVVDDIALPFGTFRMRTKGSAGGHNGLKNITELLGTEEYDLVLLDLNLPGQDGMTVLRTLRRTNRDTKVLILSARNEVSDKVAGLDAGANDYLSKPFHLAELEARIRSLTLRQFTQHDVVLSCSALTFDTKARIACAGGQPVSLTRKETGIMEYLMLHQGRPVSQEELMEHVWDNSVDNFSNSIRVHISSLRKKLRAALGYDPILNRIGEGYLMGGPEL